jgi:predicted Zn-dependent protease with MMP-like domain
MDGIGQVLRAAAIAAFVVFTILWFVNPPSLSGLEDLITLFVGGLALVLVTAAATVGLMGSGPSEAEVERITNRSEELARHGVTLREPTEFEALVVDAIDALPAEFQDAFEKVPVIVSHRGREFRAYGHYYGESIARDNYEKRIVIYQDTLERDFGWDRDALRAQVERTLRHELAHHLGWRERGVRELGL